MVYIKVESSNLAAVGYAEDGTLGIRFKNGGEYLYPGVRKAVYDGLLSASSAGSYFHKHVRHLPFVKLEVSK